MKAHARSGFSVLELLIAMAIIATALLPLVILQSQVTRSHGRQANLAEQITAERSALALVRDINPMEDPRGESRLAGDLWLQWQATPLTPVTRSIDFLGGDGTFLVALYRVDIMVRTPREQIAKLTVDRIGWRPLAAAR